MVPRADDFSFDSSHFHLENVMSLFLSADEQLKKSGKDRGIPKVNLKESRCTSSCTTR